ncbi:hypothetical protein HK105_207360 [Polyrhizophydium stewartii]|uniref:Uncharacterized protein n=1 Tax=Polyrhizophydium stewartii TaxID=2732419 RepID=A0ABR4N0S5_9FUNG
MRSARFFAVPYRLIPPRLEPGIYVCKIWTQRVSFAKLLTDFMFYTIDVFEMGDRVSDGWQAVSGLVAALLGTCKLYRKHK